MRRSSAVHTPHRRSGEIAIHEHLGLYFFGGLICMGCRTRKQISLRREPNMSGVIKGPAAAGQGKKELSFVVTAALTPTQWNQLIAALKALKIHFPSLTITKRS